MTEPPKNLWERTKDLAGDAFDAAKDSAKEGVDLVKEVASEGVEKAKELGQRAAHGASEGASAVRDKAADLMGRASEKVRADQEP